MTLSLNTLDITSFKQKGQELHDQIVRECKRLDNMNFAQYNLILMTQTQYDDLNAQAGMYDVFYTEDKMYQTPYNVMEVRIDKPKRPTFLETEELDAKQFKEWSKEVGIDE